jgi:hypothetical protein
MLSGSAAKAALESKHPAAAEDCAMGSYFSATAPRVSHGDQKSICAGHIPSGYEVLRLQVPTFAGLFVAPPSRPPSEDEDALATAGARCRRYDYGAQNHATATSTCSSAIDFSPWKNTRHTGRLRSMSPTTWNPPGQP